MSDVARDLEDDITWPAKSIKASDFAECQAHRKRTNGTRLHHWSVFCLRVGLALRKVRRLGRAAHQPTRKP